MTDSAFIYYCNAAPDAGYGSKCALLRRSKVLVDKEKKGWRQLLFDLAAILILLIVFLILLITLLGCNVERRKSDAELGLNAQQAAGRKIYDKQCDRCHEPYSTRGK